MTNSFRKMIHFVANPCGDMIRFVTWSVLHHDQLCTDTKVRWSRKWWYRYTCNARYACSSTVLCRTALGNTPLCMEQFSSCAWIHLHNESAKENHRKWRKGDRMVLSRPTRLTVQVMGRVNISKTGVGRDGGGGVTNADFLKALDYIIKKFWNNN